MVHAGPWPLTTAMGGNPFTLNKYILQNHFPGIRQPYPTLILMPIRTKFIACNLPPPRQELHRGRSHCFYNSQHGTLKLAIYFISNSKIPLVWTKSYLLFTFPQLLLNEIIEIFIYNQQFPQSIHLSIYLSKIQSPWRKMQYILLEYWNKPIIPYVFFFIQYLLTSMFHYKRNTTC
jgi:hypothetical protein